MIGVPGRVKSRLLRSCILAPVVLEQRRQPSPDADVELHPGVLRVGVVHEVPLGIRAHLERQLVVVPEEEAPLTGLGDRRRVQEHVRDGPAVPAEDGHVHARHQREVKGHVELVAVPEVGADVPRPLVGLGQEDAAAVLGVQTGPEALQEDVSLREVLAARPLALEEVGDGVAPEPVEALVEPEAHGVQHGRLDRRVVVVQIRLVAEEPVPVVRLRVRVPRPVGLLRVHEDDARIPVALVGVAPDVVVPMRRIRGGPRRLEPGVLVRRVIHDEVRDDPEPAPVRLGDEGLEVRHLAVERRDLLEVGDVVAVVPERRRIEGQEPQAVDAQVLDVVQAAR